MIFFVVIIFSLMTVLMMSASVLTIEPQKTEPINQIESNRILVNNIDEKQKIEHLLEQKLKIDQKQLPAPVQQEIAKPVVPQINNYNFEYLSKALMFIVGGAFSLISLKFLINFFNYYKTTRKFKKNTKNTQLLVDKLKTVFDNQTDFLSITDSIEHQLKINDLLLKLDESKKHGLELEVADDYLHTSYNFINEKLIGNLK